MIGPCFKNTSSRLAMAIVLSAVASCSLDVTRVSPEAIHFLAVQGASGPGQRLVEYEAPPLVERRSMATFTSDSGMYVLLRHGTDGGFYAVRFAGIASGHTWRLVRYDANWNIGASRTATELLDTVSAAAGPYLQLTADGRYLAAEFITPPNYSRSLLLLDAVTLAVVHRVAPGRSLFYQSAPTAASGSQLLLTSPNAGECPVSLAWLDAASGLVTDSTAMPCDYLLQGALARRQLYRRGPQSGPTPRNELYDVTTGAVIARGDSVRPAYLWYPIKAQGRLVWFEGGHAAVTDPQSLTLFGRVSTGGASGWPRTVMMAIADETTGLVVGAAADPYNGSFPTPDGIVVIDPVNLTFIVDQRLGSHVQVVP